jgi:trimeric autotransporter adhesin
MKKICILIITYQFIITVTAQNVGIGTITPSSSAQLDISSTTKGFLTPRMTKTQKAAIASPATGLLVYQTSPDSTGFHYYTGAGWLWLEPVSTNAWKTTGNVGTDKNINFIGTTDNEPLRLRQNNLWLGQLDINSGNYFIGRSAGNATTFGQTLIGIGSYTLTQNTSGNDNLALGEYALNKNTSGNNNIGIGNRALNLNTIGSTNIGLGNNALTTNLSGGQNIAVGFNALRFNSSGSSNVSMGSYSLENNTVGYRNTALGFSSSNNIINGYDNTAVGYNSLGNSQTNVVGSTAIGANALINNSGNYNVALGYNALLGPEDGDENIGIGPNVMEYGTTISGDNNIAIGRYAMSGTTLISGARHIGIGGAALQYLSSGDYNVAMGHFACKENTTGIGNVAIGYVALSNNTTGSGNVALGDRAFNERNGTGNVAIGKEAGGGLYNSTAPPVPYELQQNTLIGYQAGRYLKSGSANVFIGYDAGATILDTSNLLIIHNTNTTTPLLSGNFSNRWFKTQGVLQVVDSSVFFNAAGNVAVLPSNPPQSGTGRRTMWYADKAAFRTGYVNSDVWDKDSIGNYSFASGNNAKAKGSASVAFGTGSQALTAESFAIGNNAIASGMGARAMGLNVTASGDASTAIGFNNISSGAYSVALGSSNTSSALNSTATGSFNTASGDYSAAHGRFLKSKSYAGFVIGVYNDSTNAASTISNNGNNRLFQVGNGFSDNLRNNAFTILSSGLTGVNTSTPVAAVDINGDLACRQNEITVVNGVNNDIVPGFFSFIKVTGPTAAFSISGFSAGVDGKILTALNLTGQNMTIINQTSSASVTTNRINTLSGADIITTGNGSVTMQYSAADSRWMVIGVRD